MFYKASVVILVILRQGRPCLLQGLQRLHGLLFFQILARRQIYGGYGSTSNSSQGGISHVVPCSVNDVWLAALISYKLVISPADDPTQFPQVRHNCLVTSQSWKVYMVYL